MKKHKKFVAPIFLLILQIFLLNNFAHIIASSPTVFKSAGWKREIIPQFEVDSLETILVTVEFPEKVFLSVKNDSGSCAPVFQTVIDGNGTGTLSCETGDVSILKAVYRRSRIPPPPDTFCSTDVTLEVQSECNIAIYGYCFSDVYSDNYPICNPDSFDERQLLATFSCGETSYTVCTADDNIFYASCAKNYPKIISAHYGLIDECACSDVDATSATIEHCTPGSTCEIDTPSNFLWWIDPCEFNDEFKKELVVDWTCKSACSCSDVGAESIVLANCTGAEVTHGTLDSPHCLDIGQKITEISPKFPRDVYFSATVENFATCASGTIFAFDPVDTLEQVQITETYKKKYFYIGCYSSLWSTYDDYWSDIFYDDNYMTIETCFEYCNSGGYPVFALESGIYCFCQLEPILRPIASEEFCTTPCPADSSTVCGGDIGSSVFQIYEPNVVVDMIISNQTFYTQASPLKFCCEDIRKNFHGWDGKITLKIQAYSAIREKPFVISINVPENSNLLPLSYDIPVKFTLECNSTVCRSDDDFCLAYPTPSTVDPFTPFIVQSQLLLGQNLPMGIALETPTQITNAFSVFYVLGKIERNSGLTLPLSKLKISDFSDGICRIIFYNLVNSDGIPIEPLYSPGFSSLEDSNASWAPLNVSFDLDCDYSGFQSVKQPLDEVFAALGNETNSTISNYLSYLAQLYVSSDRWTSCEFLVQKILGIEAIITPVEIRTCLKLIDDPDYLSDPCCNPHSPGCCGNALINQTSILIAPYSPTSSTFSEINSAISQNCFYPTCTQHVMQNYATAENLQSSASGCLQIQDKIKNVYPNLDATAAWKNCSHYDDITALTIYNINTDYMIDCLLSFVDQFVKEYLVDLVNKEYLTNSSGNLTFKEKVIATTTFQYCAWFGYCTIGVSLGCTLENCLDPALLDEFCADCSTGVCFPADWYPPHCALDSSNVGDMEAICNSLAESGIPVHYNSLVPACLRNDTLAPIPCQSHPGCIPNYTHTWDSYYNQYWYSFTETATSTKPTCNSYCYLPNLASDVLCNIENTALDGSLYQLLWFPEESKCVLDPLYEYEIDTGGAWCTQNGGKIFYGWLWFGSPITECYGYCYSDYQEITAEDCASSSPLCSTCGVSSVDDFCFDMDLCTEQVSCSVSFGCLQEEDEEDYCLYWTPYGCINTTASEAECVTGTWLNFSSKTSCEEFSSVCALIGSDLTPGYGRPAGITDDNQPICNSCHAKQWVPLFRWGRATWSYNWISYEWRTTGITKLFTIMPFSAWNSRQSRAANTYLGLLYNSLLTCKYGQTKDLLSQITCGCASGGNSDSACGQQLANNFQRIFAIYPICSNVPFSEETSSISITAYEFTTLTNQQCIELSYHVFDLNQLNTRTSQLGIDSLDSYQRFKGSKKFILNSNDLVVGEILGNGNSFSTRNNVQITNDGITICFLFPEISSQLPIRVLDLVVTYDFATFLPLKLNLPLNYTQWCTTFNGSNASYFPAGFVENSDSLEYFSTWETGQLVLMYIVAVIILALLIWDIYNLQGHVRHFDSHRVWNLPIMASVLLAVFLIDRFIYFCILPYGWLQEQPYLNVIFADLPALIFLSIYSVVVVRWAEIYHFTMTSATESRLYPIAIIFNVILYAIFIIFLAVYFTVQAPPQILNCAQDLLEETTPSIVATAYKVFFLVGSILIAGVFLTYGFKLFFLVQEGLETRARGKTNANIRLLLVTLLCTLGLLGQSINLIVSLSSYAQNNVYVSIVLVLFLELLPTVILLYLFQYNSAFTKRRDKTNSTKRTAASRAAGERSTNNERP